MKVFADAALYHKKPNWSSSTADLFQEVGTSEMSSRPLIEYTLTTPGVHTAIIGIGHIDEDPQKCQLVQNFTDAQIEPNGMAEIERNKIEELTKTLKPNSNFFQMAKVGLTKPRNLRNDGNTIIWDNASGQKLIEKTAQGTQVKFEVSDLRKGVYFARFADGSSKKFIKQ